MPQLSYIILRLIKLTLVFFGFVLPFPLNHFNHLPRLRPRSPFLFPFIFFGKIDLRSLHFRCSFMFLCLLKDHSCFFHCDVNTPRLRNFMFDMLLL
ncbi:hypothetical protein BC829DRAFT_79963 [Chytridium lagenaria]|nr:hypothetical protein BC829DRAFT_79963 [Chytridium lagenaria]